MTGGYEGGAPMLYVGVDAHKSTSQITVMNEAGVILRRKRVHGTSEGLQRSPRRIR